MNKTTAIQVIEKYKDVSCSLGLKDDEATLDDILTFIKSSKSVDFSEDANKQRKNKYGEPEFQAIVSNADVSVFDIDARIVTNKDKIIDFWHLLNDKERNSFTIFELNIILYFISKQYNKYQKKDKKRILSMINAVVKDKRMDDAYNNIVV